MESFAEPQDARSSSVAAVVPVSPVSRSARQSFGSEAVHVVERFTMVDADTIHYEARIEDPAVYTTPWTMVFAIRRVKDPGYEVFEEACHEGEMDTEHLLATGLRIYPGIVRDP